jgi:hypothetical protein
MPENVIKKSEFNQLKAEKSFYQQVINQSSLFDIQSEKGFNILCWNFLPEIFNG